MSRDEQNVLVVSYAELKNCLEQVSHVLLMYATVRPALSHLGRRRTPTLKKQCLKLVLGLLTIYLIKQHSLGVLLLMLYIKVLGNLRKT